MPGQLAMKTKMQTMIWIDTCPRGKWRNLLRARYIVGLTFTFAQTYIADAGLTVKEVKHKI